MASTKYKKYTHLEHILARPDTYIGSLVPDTSKQWVVTSESRMVEKQLTHIGGLFKIFDEVLVNAIDHSTVPDHKVDKIQVVIDAKEGFVRVTNTGQGIPIEYHTEYGNKWIPELIFGELLTSSNYDDSQSRVTGGRNGYGAKLANVFSSRFEIDITCTVHKKRYVQQWTENMSKKNTPKITKYSKSKGYTTITFYPDFKKFNLNGFDEDIIDLMKRRTYDVCACTDTNVQVSYNGQVLQCKSFDKYVDFYIGNKQESNRIYYSTPDNRWHVCITSSSTGFKQVSFVNGIHTSQGGSHVEYVMGQLIRKITEYLVQKHKNIQIKPQYIKEHLFLFVKSTIVNPSFSSQTKTECTTRYKDFGSRCDIPEDIIKKLVKMPFVEDVVELAKHKEMRDLHKTDGRKTSVIRGIPKLEDANKAGTSQSNKCTLILTEGDSAKTFAISGLSIVGRDYYGVFPLKGKLLNVREATAKQLANNEEINHLKQIIGLQMDKEYNETTRSSLRYGSVMILTDADVDGSHIKGLFINFIHHFWPSLLTKCKQFVTSMKTPILKAQKGNDVLCFYTKHDYEQWKQKTDIQRWKIKYYKGLGTSTSQEAKEYFRQLGDIKIEYHMDTKSDQSMLLAFQKTYTDARKEWIKEGTRRKETLGPAQLVSVHEFVYKDLIWFSMADNERSIPSVIDGLKPSQRKVVYACRKRQNTEIKVSQLSGYVSTETCYHHGEASLMSTIVGMAQDFVGSNNMNLLVPKGQFGTRLMGGKDTASPRYIFTQLSSHSNHLFSKHDDPLLTYVNDDGSWVEPEYFVPILPIILINGADGIGTGYSTSVPNYNLKDVKENVIRALSNKPLHKMVPWYNGFTGTIKESEEGKFVTCGSFEYDQKTLIIRELPIGKWTSDYKEFLETLIDQKIIKQYENHSTENKVEFVIVTHSAELSRDYIVKTFKLTSTVHTTNMHCFDHKGTIQKYDSPEEIIREFTQVRIKYYVKRKEWLIRTWSKELEENTIQLRFMKLVMNDKIVVFKQPKTMIRSQLIATKFEESVHESLLNIRLSSFTEENIQKLESEIHSQRMKIDELQGTSVTQLWTNDLNQMSD